MTMQQKQDKISCLNGSHNNLQVKKNERTSNGRFSYNQLSFAKNIWLICCGVIKPNKYFSFYKPN